jgi:hypothetical protein
MELSTMKNFFLHLVALTVAVAAVSNGQGFDLMNMQPSNKVATSSNFVVSTNGIEQYRSNATSSPYAIVTGDTLYVGSEQKTTSVNDGGTMLAASTLQQNFPNPFNNATVIRFTLNEMSDVTITVFDVTGREVTTLVNGTKQSGTFSVGFSNNTIASGTYIYRMTARSASGNTTVETKKMIVMK